MKKVKINKSTLETYWYNKLIGDEFEVEDEMHSLGYQVTKPTMWYGCIINPDDCEIVESIN